MSKTCTKETEINKLIVDGKQYDLDLNATYQITSKSNNFSYTNFKIKYKNQVVANCRFELHKGTPYLMFFEPTNLVPNNNGTEIKYGEYLWYNDTDQSFYEKVITQSGKHQFTGYEIARAFGLVK
jgi:hypothetical protein